MLDSGCANAWALNGLPGPMRHWFTGFTHSHLRSGTWEHAVAVLKHVLSVIKNVARHIE